MFFFILVVLFFGNPQCHQCDQESNHCADQTDKHQFLQFTPFIHVSNLGIAGVIFL